MKTLQESEIEARLAKRPDWSRLGDSISRTFQFRGFVDAMRFVNAVAEHAEKTRHHPDIMIRWNKVTLTLTTHDANGLTEKDFSSAAKADETSRKIEKG